MEDLRWTPLVSGDTSGPFVPPDGVERAGERQHEHPKHPELVEQLWGIETPLCGSGDDQNAPNSGDKLNQQEWLDAYLVLSDEGDDSPEKLREDKDEQYPVQNLQRCSSAPCSRPQRKWRLCTKSPLK